MINTSERNILVLVTLVTIRASNSHSRQTALVTIPTMVHQVTSPDPGCGAVFVASESRT